QGTAARARLQQRWQHGLAQMGERDLVTEEEGLVGGHAFDHLRCQHLGPGPHLLHEFGNPGEPNPARQRHQPALDQILLVGGEIETRTLLQELTQELIVRERHDRSPENNRTSFGAIWLSGRMAAQMPALAGAPRPASPTPRWWLRPGRSRCRRPR